MFEVVLKRYLKPDELKGGVLFLGEAKISPDFLIDLVKANEKLYAIVQADYLFMNTMVQDIQGEFPVQVKGWLRALPHTHLGLVPAELFKSPNVSEGSDEEWEAYRQVVIDGEGWWKHALLEVNLNPGVTVQDLIA